MISSATPRSRSKRRIWKPSSSRCRLRAIKSMPDCNGGPGGSRVRADWKTEATVAPGKKRNRPGARGRRSPDRFRTGSAIRGSSILGRSRQSSSVKSSASAPSGSAEHGAGTGDFPEITRGVRLPAGKPIWLGRSGPLAEEQVKTVARPPKPSARSGSAVQHAREADIAMPSSIYRLRRSQKTGLTDDRS